MKSISNTPNAPAPVGAYNQAVWHNDILYVSGQIALHPRSGELVLDDIPTETHQVMKNLRAILLHAGLTFDNVLKCSIFVSDMENYSEINEVYASYFDEDTAPARELVQVANLPRYVNIEISLIAGK